MNELSIFIDESGDFGAYNCHSPYYIITMVFHKQEISIDRAVGRLDYELSQSGFFGHCIHTGPIIRQEKEYSYLGLKERRSLFNKMTSFIRQSEIQYKCFSVEKKQFLHTKELYNRLIKNISIFIRENYSSFLSYDSVKIYYDNGQTELSRLLSHAFSTFLSNIEFRKVIPAEYKLFQAADLLCTMELIRLKAESGSLSNSEKIFFGSLRNLKKNYLNPLSRKKFIRL